MACAAAADDARIEHTVTRRITVTGVVQGVGFRPFVVRTAARLNLTGSVANAGGFVLITARGRPAALEAFVEELTRRPPVHARIERVNAENAPQFVGQGFSVLESAAAAGPRHISPDLGICQDCRREILSDGNRLSGHAFNACADCGPRFSVTAALPYDRAVTTMAAFPLCPRCAAEYGDVSSRRFRAECLSCADCGPALTYFDGDRSIQGPRALTAAADAVAAGNVIAVKGVGGFHYACSALDEAAVVTLRRLKHREAKPLAVMLPGLDAAELLCEVSAEEREALLSPAAPIVLLSLKEKNALAPSVLEGCRRCGCFLPYTPLHVLLMERLGRPMVLTSANLSGEAIVYEDQAMACVFSSVPRPTGLLTHDRVILRGVEDSVVQRSAGGMQPLRRSRGFVPAPLKLTGAAPDGPSCLCMGGDLKASFGLVRGDTVYLSQYFGDLENAGAHARYREAIGDFLRLFDASPQFVLCDAHPRYLSAGLARSLGLPVASVQHHHAHAASVMAERGLREAIAVCFDGTGFGPDGTIWGGEFLVCRRDSFVRAGHLAPVTLLGGESAARDTERTADGYLIGAGLPPRTPNAALYGAAIACRVNTFVTSSAGRLFDAVAAALGLCGRSRYEGECAVRLQEAAEEALTLRLPPVDLRFDILDGGMPILDHRALFVRAAAGRDDVRAFALGFHLALADAAAGLCAGLSARERLFDVALSGGVFQNALLTSLLTENLIERGLRPHINRLVPPNDGGLALGQAWIGQFLSNG